ncbi:MAG TPA: glucose 1-dehydrogenase [Roseiflexaceae bacterium]|nr:glucose 1-dehydrogenase [Roseiflexaceae bacterium]
MEIRFDDKVVLITGASTGIGATLARAFAEAGADIVVHYNSSKEAAEAVARDVEAAGRKALLVQADVTRSEERKKLAEAALKEFGRVDVLINNAGGLVRRSPVADLPEELYNEVMDLNFASTVMMCKEIIPTMQKQGGGAIINVTSVAARHGGGSGALIYAASKGAISTFTHGLAKELAPHNIRVNALSPGVILTPFHEKVTSQAQMDAMVATIPMGRAGTTEECVGAAFFLASDTMAGYVTGQILEVNGGQYMP